MPRLRDPPRVPRLRDPPRVPRMRDPPRVPRMRDPPRVPRLRVRRGRLERLFPRVLVRHDHAKQDWYPGVAGSYFSSHLCRLQNDF